MNEVTTIFENGNIVLIITAILSLIGVTIAAILNYTSNLKTNKAKIELEDRVARYPYLQEGFEELRKAYRKLDEDNRKLSTTNGEQENFDILNQNHSNALVLFKEVEPYLNKTDRDDLKAKHDEIRSIEDKISVLVLSLPNSPMSDDFIALYKDTIDKKVDFTIALKKVISKDITTISDVLRNYT